MFVLHGNTFPEWTDLFFPRIDRSSLPIHPFDRYKPGSRPAGVCRRQSSDQPALKRRKFIIVAKEKQ
jgi:hypothetical protein